MRKTIPVIDLLPEEQEEGSEGSENGESNRLAETVFILDEEEVLLASLLQCGRRGRKKIPMSQRM